MTNYSYELGRLIIGILFLVSSIAKIKDRLEFVHNLETSFKLPHPLAQIAHACLVLLEFLLAISLLTQIYFYPLALLMSFILMIGFTLVITFFLIMDIPFKCNCFGETPHTANVGDLIRNGVFVSITALLYFTHSSSISIQPLEAIALITTAIIAFMIIANIGHFIYAIKKG